MANETPEESLANMKKITPSFKSDDLYGAMKYTLENPTNNLRRLSGSPFFAKGVPLYIEGKVFDISGRHNTNYPNKPLWFLQFSCGKNQCSS